MILDIILIGILVLSAFIGYKKGLVGTIMGIITIIIALLFAFILQNSVANSIYKNTAIGSTIQEKISNTLETEITKNGEEALKENNFISSFIPSDEITENIVSTVAPQVTLFIIKGVSFVAIFVIVYIICYMLTMILNIVFKLPILGSVNKFGGVATNILKSIVKIWVILALISFVSFMPFVSGIQEYIQKTTITKMLYDNNIIVNMLKPKV